MLVFMRALPGRDSRTTLADPPAAVTRSSAHADQRRRILRAVGELVAKRGYGDVTVELIVKRARVSYKTFYSHFAGKEECFLELFDETMVQTRARIEAALAAESGAPWPRQVVAALRALFEVLLADPLIARASIVEAPTVGPSIIERYEKAMSDLSPLLRQGREQSPYRDELPETLEDTLAGGVLWSAYQRLIVGQAEQIESLLPDAIEFVLRPYLGEEEAATWAKQAGQPAGEAASAAS
jgi:AcrR family transcriptional regulator